ncbi:MAG TPA: hypothetical protein VHP61_03365, partial [Acidobacteriota bacterium]|nr:hypothetical protein [Acidobacteriota bacterium]
MIRTANLTAWEKPIRRALDSIAGDRVLERILAKDFTVWKDEGQGITNRLGWLDPIPKALEELPAIEAFVHDARKA